MKRSELTPIPEYFDRYINKCDDVELLEAMRIAINELDAFPIEKWKALGDKVYAPGKWTVKDILQHLIDTERIFCYRALAFARNEMQTMPMFSEDEYAVSAEAVNRNIEDLVNELRTTHVAAMSLFKSFTPAMLNKVGKGFRGMYSIASIGFILPGHQRWHLAVLEEKYYHLLGK